MKNYRALALVLITAILGIHCTAHAGELVSQTVSSQEESIFHSLPTEIRRHIVFLALALAKQYGDYEYTKTLVKLQNYCSNHFSMLLSPDGNTLFLNTLCSNKDERYLRLLICDLARETERELIYTVHSGPEMVLSPCGSFLTMVNTCSDASSCRNIETGTLVNERFIERSRWKNLYTQGLSPDGTLLFMELKNEKKGPFDPEAQEYFWNTKTGQRICSWEEVKKVREDGYLLKVEVKNPPKIKNSASLWNQETGEQIVELKEYQQSAEALAFSPDKKTIAVFTEDRDESPRFERLGLWSSETGQLIHTFKMEDYSPYRDGSHILFASKSLDGNSLIFSPGGTMLMVRYISNRGVFKNSREKICLWHVQTGKLLREFTITGYFHYCYFSPDGDTIVIHETGNKSDKYYSKISLWDIQENRKIGKLRTRKNISNLVEITTEGNFLIVVKVEYPEDSYEVEYPEDSYNSEIQLWSRPQAESTFQLFKKLYPLFHLKPLNEPSLV